MHSEHNHQTDQNVEQIAEHASHDHHHDHSAEQWISREWIGAIISGVLLIGGLFIDAWIAPTGWVRFSYYCLAYIPVGGPVVWSGLKLAMKGQIFTEFFLMSIATIGAFYLNEYPEGVAVMLFYTVGELVQGAAVTRAKRSIKALLDVRPKLANVLRNGVYVSVPPMEVKPGETIQIKVGERVPLDGQLLSSDAVFNTSALTGESSLAHYSNGAEVLAGMINESNVVEIAVTKTFRDSALSRILDLVQNALGRKAKTELFIRKFAKVYTPIVVYIAVALTLLPYFFVASYNFEIWFYRALIFLVVSCPCALVVAIPVGYFGGIGAGCRHGIVFKGSSFLDKLTRVGTVVFDKTGTLTTGKFTVIDVVAIKSDSREWLPYVAVLEQSSNHPVSRAIQAYSAAMPAAQANEVQELRGKGMRGVVEGKEVLAGNGALMASFDMPVRDAGVDGNTIIHVAIDRVYQGYIMLGDSIKDDAQTAIRQLHHMSVDTVILSGDNNAIVKQVASNLGVSQSYGDLLPEDKVLRVESIKTTSRHAVAFVGDGINDAPVLALSDVGIAMGGLGSDAAIETADVVIQTDQPSKVGTAIIIAKATNRIVWQNIGFAFGVKIIVMALGAWGVASMWEAVFADVGVALLAILNAIRIQRKKF